MLDCLIHTGLAGKVGSARERERSRGKAFTRGCKYTERNSVPIYMLRKYFQMSKIEFVLNCIEWNSFNLDFKFNISKMRNKF